MSRIKLIFIFLLSYNFASNQVVNIDGNTSLGPIIDVSSIDNENIHLSFTLDQFYLQSVEINNQEFFRVEIEGGASLLESGFPDLPKFSKSIIIPNNKKMIFEIENVEYVEYDNILIAPSKGNFFPFKSI